MNTFKCKTTILCTCIPVKCLALFRHLLIYSYGNSQFETITLFTVSLMIFKIGLMIFIGWV